MQILGTDSALVPLCEHTLRKVSRKPRPLFRLFCKKSLHEYGVIFFNILFFFPRNSIRIGGRLINSGAAYKLYVSLSPWKCGPNFLRLLTSCWWIYCKNLILTPASLTNKAFCSNIYQPASLFYCNSHSRTVQDYGCVPIPLVTNGPFMSKYLVGPGILNMRQSRVRSWIIPLSHPAITRDIFGSVNGS